MQIFFIWNGFLFANSLSLGALCSFGALCGAGIGVSLFEILYARVLRVNVPEHGVFAYRKPSGMGRCSLSLRRIRHRITTQGIRLKTRILTEQSSEYERILYAGMEVICRAEKEIRNHANILLRENRVSELIDQAEKNVWSGEYAGDTCMEATAKPVENTTCERVGNVCGNGVCAKVVENTIFKRMNHVCREEATANKVAQSAQSLAKLLAYLEVVLMSPKNLLEQERVIGALSNIYRYFGYVDDSFCLSRRLSAGNRVGLCLIGKTCGIVISVEGRIYIQVGGVYASGELKGVQLVEETNQSISVLCQGVCCQIRILQIGGFVVTIEKENSAAKHFLKEVDSQNYSREAENPIVPTILTELSQKLCRDLEKQCVLVVKKVVCQTRTRTEIQWVVCEHEQERTRVNELLKNIGGCRLLERGCENVSINRLCHVLREGGKVRPIKYEQLYLWLGQEAKGIGRRNLYLTANYIAVYADGHFEQSELASAYRVVSFAARFGVNCHILVVGEAKNDTKLENIAIVPSDFPCLESLEEYALLVMRGGRWLYHNFENCPPQYQGIARRAIECTVDERYGINELTVGIRYMCSDIAEKTENLALYSIMGMGTLNRVCMRAAVLRSFACQTLEGELPYAFTPFTAIWDGYFPTLSALALLAVYVSWYGDADILTETVSYAEVEGLLWYTGRIRDTLLYHAINALSYGIERACEEVEGKILRFSAHVLMRFCDNPSVLREVTARLDKLNKLSSTKGTIGEILSLYEGKGDPLSVFRSLSRMRGRRRELGVALYTHWYYTRQLGISLRGGMIAIKPQIQDFTVRIGCFTAEICKGENGMRVGNRFYRNLQYVSMTTDGVVTIYIE